MGFFYTLGIGSLFILQNQELLDFLEVSHVDISKLKKQKKIYWGNFFKLDLKV